MTLIKSILATTVFSIFFLSCGDQPAKETAASSEAISESAESSSEWV